MGVRTSRGAGATTSGGGGDVAQRAVGKGTRAQAAQRRSASKPAAASAAEAASGGLPAQLKAGTEAMSGVAMDDVKVHTGSSKPAEIGALAYAQGSDIHLGPGQEAHLPHEAWHVAQQKQGRVAATTQAKGVDVNDDEGLEAEADEMGAKAVEVGRGKEAKRDADDPAAEAPGKADGGGGAGGEDEAQEAEREVDAGPPPGGDVVQPKRGGDAAVIQAVKKKGVVIDVATLTADLCKEHISRAFRLKAGKGAGDDADYTYEPDDVAKLQARQKTLKDGEVLAKLAALRSALVGQLAGLVGAADFTTPPPWIGKATTGVEGSESSTGKNMAADAGVVVAAWQAFLGAGPYTNKHPRTGVATSGRLVSADGKRSIRYGDHEHTKSKPQDHHYHEETWTWDGASTVTVENKVQKVPVT